jgi:predicted phage terminase large subunit-like protein
LVIDDPISAEEANSKQARERAIRWKTETMSSRFNDQARAQEVLVMQRLHEDDLAGYLLKAGGWVHLRLPSRYETKRSCKCETCAKGSTPIGWKDPRKREGELLFPVKFSDAVLKEAEIDQGHGRDRVRGATPTTPHAGGGRRPAAEVVRPSLALPDRLRARVQGSRRGARAPRLRPAHLEAGNARMIVTDAAFKKKAENDLVAIGMFDVVFPDLYLIDWTWDRMGLIDTINAILALRKKWDRQGARVGRVAIEDKANGPGIIEVLKTKIPGIVEVEPLGSKEARVMAAAPYLHAGNVWLAEAHTQVEEAVAESAAFPKASHDDWIDMLSYGILLNLVSSDLSKLEGLVRW